MTLKKKKKNRRRWLLWALLAIAILLVAGYVYNSNKAPEGEPVDFEL